MSGGGLYSPPTSPAVALGVLPALRRVFVLVSLYAFAGELHLNLTFLHNLGLASEPRARTNVEGLVDDVGLIVFLIAELVCSFSHVDVARRACAHAAARTSFGDVRLGRGFQDRRPHGDLDLSKSLESNDRHESFRRALSERAPPRFPSRVRRSFPPSRFAALRSHGRSPGSCAARQRLSSRRRALRRAC